MSSDNRLSKLKSLLHHFGALWRPWKAIKGGAASAGRVKRASKRRPGEQNEKLFDDEFLKKLEYLYIVSKKVFAGKIRAERRSRKVGAGVEFTDHRDYSPGDDFRYLDWNLYGRMDRLLLRLFEEEEDLYIYLLLDCSASMAFGDPAKLEYAKRVAAALSYIGLANLDRVCIIPYATEVKGRLPPARGKGRIFKVFDFLTNLDGGGTTDLTSTVRQFVHQNRRRGLAVVLSDFYDPGGYEDALNFLRYHRFNPVLIHLFDDRELNPSLKGDLSLIDCETGSTREVTVSIRTLSAYARALQDYYKELEDFCRKRQMPYFRTAIQVPFDELVLKIFRAGGFLK